MLRLLTKCATFALPLVVLLSGLEWGLSRVPNSYTHKRSIIQRGAPSVEVLVTGSSREYFGVDPAELPCRAINLANTSQSLPIDSALVRAYLPRMKKLRVLVLPVSVFSLDYRLSDSPEAWRLPLFQHAFGLAVPEEGPRSFLESTLIWGYGPAAILGIAARGFRGPSDEADDRGWLPSAPAGEISVAAGRARARFHMAMMHRSHRPANLDALVATIRAASGAGARVVLLVTPAMPTYVQALPSGLLKEFRETLRSISRRTGAITADYLEDPRFSTPDFLDNDHLSPVGAKRFSTMLGSEQIAPLLGAPCAPPDMGAEQ